MKYNFIKASNSHTHIPLFALYPLSFTIPTPLALTVLRHKIRAGGKFPPNPRCTAPVMIYPLASCKFMTRYVVFLISQCKMLIYPCFDLFVTPYLYSSLFKFETSHTQRATILGMRLEKQIYVLTLK